MDLDAAEHDNEIYMRGLQDGRARRPDAAPPKEELHELPPGWVASPSVLYQGREYAMVVRNNKPWFCSRQSDNDPWIVEVATPPSDAAPVAWRYRLKEYADVEGSWSYRARKPQLEHNDPERDDSPDDYDVQPLYAHPEDAPGGPTKKQDPHWPYTRFVDGDTHRNCGGQLRYRVLNRDHDDREYRCDKCEKTWVEEGPDA